MALWISVHLLQPSPPDQRKAALALLRYSPRLALMGKEGLVLEVASVLSLFGGPRALCQRIRASLHAAALPARIGMAPAASGAWVLARHRSQPAWRRVLTLASLGRVLDALPLHLLPASGPWLDWLQAMGCHSLGQADRLPRAGLVQRGAAMLGQQLDAAYGRQASSFDWFCAPEVFDALQEIAFPARTASDLMAVASRLLEQACRWLRSRNAAAGQMEFLLHHEKRRHGPAASALSLRLSEPDWQQARFLALLAEQLPRQILAAPVIAMGLRCSAWQPRTQVSETLFADPAQYPQQERQLMDMLCARLGARHVLRPLPVASHLPEQANQWVAATDAKALSRRPKTDPGPMLDTRPFWLLETPQRLGTQRDRPVYHNRPLRLLRGPERLESGWWADSGPQQRDYFMATDAAQRYYWIYRLRGTDCPEWFLHGLFA